LKFYEISALLSAAYSHTDYSMALLEHLFNSMMLQRWQRRSYHSWFKIHFVSA